MKLIRPAAANSTLSTSSFTFCVGTSGFTNARPAIMSTTTATNVGRNMARQPKYVTMRPETTGPNAGPNVMQQLPMDRYVPSFLRGAIIRTVFIMMGTKMPVPTAWNRRAPRSTAKFGATKSIALPSARMMPPAKKLWRSVSRRIRNAITAVITADTIM